MLGYMVSSGPAYMYILSLSSLEEVEPNSQSCYNILDIHLQQQKEIKYNLLIGKFSRNSDAAQLLDLQSL